VGRRNEGVVDLWWSEEGRLHSKKRSKFEKVKINKETTNGIKIGKMIKKGRE
jgi:hypothetical protein